MVERSQNLSLALKAVQPIGIVSEMVGQEFQRDVALELSISRAINHTHPTFAERRRNFIGSDA
jgi:hypothetical protein